MVSLREMETTSTSSSENRYEVYGRRKGRVFTLGDAVRIRVKRADLPSAVRLDFELVHDAAADSERRKGARSDSGTPPKHVPTG